MLFQERHFGIAIPAGGVRALVTLEVVDEPAVDCDPAAMRDSGRSTTPVYLDFIDAERFGPALVFEGLRDAPHERSNDEKWRS